MEMQDCWTTDINIDLSLNEQSIQKYGLCFMY